MDKMTITINEMAQMLGINDKLARELVRREGFPVVRLGKKKTVILLDELKKWLVENSGFAENKK